MDWHGALVSLPVADFMSKPLVWAATHGTIPRTFQTNLADARNARDLSRRLFKAENFKDFDEARFKKQPWMRIRGWTPGASARHAFGSHYNPLAGSIKAPLSSPGLVAHELGHARQHGSLLAANILGKLITGLGMWAQAATGNRETSEKWRNFAMSGGLATLLTELDASNRGRNMLRAQGVRGLKSWHSFAGVPSYATLVAAPYILQALKERHWGKAKPNTW